ncbi:transcription factor TGA like domain-containing protein [Artemisia annua]|uniref:Transcription factor TGA like domain-containing protein n=1 Tax=Artemisia annua TaxID=35608 RepID=A0A2U1P180_ARTAN|nr:transcription factor TGA like domain-containing protein [Artemisia annua]
MAIKHQQSQCCYQNWAAQQRLDLDELLQALTNYPTDTEYLQLITKKVITHFENYNAARAQLAKHDGPSFLAPAWGSTFENSFLWIGGCRPSLIIRIVHGNLGEISSPQLKSIDDLQAKTIKDEDKLTSRMATLQENVADEPLGLLANNHRQGQSSDDAVVDKTMDSYAHDQYSVLIEADKLRLNVLKGMIDILTPLQATELLVASKKLHLSLHEWGKRRDIRMGSTELLNNNIPSSSHDLPPRP